MEESCLEFKAFVRFLLDALREVADETDAEKRDAKMNRVLDNLQKTLEA